MTGHVKRFRKNGKAYKIIIFLERRVYSRMICSWKK